CTGFPATRPTNASWRGPASRCLRSGCCDPMATWAWRDAVSIRRWREAGLPTAWASCRLSEAAETQHVPTGKRCRPRMRARAPSRGTPLALFRRMQTGTHRTARVVGTIVVAQEGRFKLVRADGRYELFVLAH